MKDIDNLKILPLSNKTLIKEQFSSVQHIIEK